MKIKSGWPFAIALATGAAVFIYCYLVRPQGTFSWDESHHSTYSLLIAKSTREGDWRSFWHYTNSQVYWPFFHSWVSSIFLLIGGFSYRAARFTNVVIGWLAVLLTYRTGRMIREGHREAVGMGAAGLLVLSPMFLFFSATAMIENLGLLLSLAIVACQIRAVQINSPRHHFLSGVALGLLYLTKYEYAQFMGLALVLFWLSWVILPPGRGGERLTAGGVLMALFGFFLFWGAWMVVPPSAPKWGVLIYRFGDTGKFNPLSYTPAENRLFYLRALLYAYAFSPGIYLLYLGGLAYGLIRFRRAAPRLLLLVFLSSLIPMSLIANSQERFIYTTTPALYLLAAAGAVECAERARRAALALAALVGLLALGDLHKLPRYFREVGSSVIGVRAYRDATGLSSSTLFGLGSYPRFWQPQREYFNPRAGGRIPRHTAEDVLRFIWETASPRASICAPFYIGELSPHLWQWHSIVQARPIVTEWRPEAFYFAALSVDADSPHYLLWNSYLIEGRVRGWVEFISSLEKKGLLKRVAERRFPDAGLGISLYVKNQPLSDPRWRGLHYP